jgi:hypothetical protein
MDSEKLLGRVCDLLTSEGLAEMCGDSCCFSAAGHVLTREKVNREWYFFYTTGNVGTRRDVNEDDVLYWVPANWKTWSTLEPECWTFLKPQEVTEETVSRFCKFFGIRDVTDWNAMPLEEVFDMPIL